MASPLPQTVRRDLERSILNGVKPLVWASLALDLAYFAGVVALGQPSWWQLAQTLTLVAMTIGLFDRWAHEARAKVVIGALLAFALTGFEAFGPLLGIGVLLTFSVLASTLYFGRSGAWVSVVLIVSAVAVTAVVAHRGPASWGVEIAPIVWVRMLVASSLGLAGAAYVFHAVRESAIRAIADQAALLERQITLEHERERFLTAAAASQRLESLGRLAGGVAHDLNNALSVIIAGSDSLRESSLGPPQQEILDDIDRSARQAAGTARQLLTFSRGNPMQPGACELAEVLARFAASVRDRLPPGVTLEVQSAATGSIPLADSQFEQVLLNLVLNARDAMPGGGTIAVRSRTVGDGLEVEVADTGVGLEEAIRSKIFEPFFTTKGPAATGLGLAIVWGTVRGVGGTVEVDSTPGTGATFRLRFPRVEPPSATARRTPAPRTTPAPSEAVRSPRRVLFLEDEPAIRHMVERLLHHAGYLVSSHEVAATAIDALRTQSFDLLFTDAAVPGGGVGDLIRAFRATRAGAPVVVCSGHIREELVLEGVADTEYHFLGKPFSPKALVGLVAEQLADYRA